MNHLVETVVSQSKRVADILSVDPFGPAMERGFWNPTFLQNDDTIRVLTGNESLGIRGAEFVMRLRFLPTDEVLAAVKDAYGSGADALLAEWRELFDRLDGGIDGFVQATGYDECLDYTSSFQVSDRTATRLMLGRGGLTEASALYAAAADIAAGPAPREPTQHALEDALIMTSYVRAKVPVNFLAIFDGDKEGLKPEERTVRFLRFSRSGKPKVRTPSRLAVKRLKEGFKASNPYWGWPSFRQCCGRALQETLGVRQLTLTLLDMAKQGIAKAFLKSGAFKGGTWVVALEGIQRESDAASALIRAIGPEWPRLLAALGSPEALDPSFIVQEFKPFKFEHRFFVVGDRIVASTPSDRTLSILDAVTGPRRLDPRVAVLDQPAEHAGPYDRGITRSIEDRKMVAGMARLARRFLKGLNEGDSRFIPRPPAYVIDVGCGPDGHIGLIEVNTFRNAGFYALDYTKVARAFRTKDSWTDKSFAERLLNAPESGPGAQNAIRVVFKMATAVGAKHTWQVVEQDEWRPLPEGTTADIGDD